MRLRLLLLLGVVLSVGCGSPRYAPVSGTLQMDGEPLANVAVSFQPIGEGQMVPGPGSAGRTNEKGEYTLVVIGDGSKGAVLGLHRVEVNNTVDGNPDEDRRPPTKSKAARVPARYNLQSELTFEVKSGNNTANFNLTAQPLSR